ncbi:MAG: prephenate dehydrogenase/arogenate dehydrogenase family protein [Dehalococcoidia bacterium]|nr:MAG: prephenate dehydrogenase/arogenate dehydrogenase family protein [Dehalococcoidia bacterium]
MTRIAIIGLGLIGGSMGLALKKVADLELVGFARRPEVASKALSIGAVDRAEGNLLSAVKEANLVIIATPVVAIKEILAQIGERLSQGCIVTDTASTKAQVMGWAEEFLPSSVSFIGGHPMAGKEASGIEAADAALFAGCTYCLVPGRGATTEAINVVEGLVRQIGAKPIFLNAPEHDSLVAAISHLPLLLSAALVSATTRSPSWPKMAKLAATGFRDLTRLASGNPVMSLDICLTNREPILHWIDEYIKELGEFRRLVSEGGQEMEQAFIRARQGRERWLGEIVEGA